MSKKDKKQNITKQNIPVGDILKINSFDDKKEYRSVYIQTTESREEYSVKGERAEEIITTALTPGRLTVDKDGYALVKFDNGSKEKFELAEILIGACNLADNQMNRYYLTFGAYAANHLGIDIESDDKDIGDESRRISIDKMVTSLYDEHRKDETESDDRRERGINYLYEDLLANDVTSAFYIWEQLKRLCNSIEPIKQIVPRVIQQEKHTLEAINKFEELGPRSDLSMRYVYNLVGGNSEVIRLINESYKGRPLSDEESVQFLMDIYDTEQIKEFLKEYGANLVGRKVFVKHLINKKVVTENELHELIDEMSALNCYLSEENKELLRYMGVSGLVTLYVTKGIDAEQVARYSTIKELLMTNIDKKIKMDILLSGKNTRVYATTDTALMWEYFEKDYFSVEEMKKLEELRYIHVDTIIKNYNCDRARKIAKEMGVIDAITDEKILGFFTADIIARELKSNSNNEKKDFYNKDLRAIYEAAGRNFEQELAEIITSVDDSKKTKAYLECFRLYNDGVLSANTLNDIGIPEYMFINDYLESKNDSKLIEFYNSGLISQDSVIDILDDDFDERVFELIKNGMSASIIKGFYSTIQLIDFTRDVNYAGIPIEPKLSVENLAELKDDIDTGLDKEPSNLDKTTTLLDLYLDNTISYTDLYDMAELGIISKEEADEINDHYNLDQGVAALEKVGVSGQSLENIFRAEPVPGAHPQAKPYQSRKREAIGVEGKYIAAFYERMGAKNTIQIDADECPVFRDYVIIPIISKKIGFLEGDDGRTYILPLKIILEQINNPRGQMDLIGNATSRNDFNRDKRFVRSTNHTKNWVENTIKKASEISSSMSEQDVKKLKVKCKDLIENVRNSYDMRKAKSRD